jgi:hypothetical protein
MDVRKHRIREWIGSIACFGKYVTLEEGDFGGAGFLFKAVGDEGVQLLGSCGFAVTRRYFTIGPRFCSE